MTKKNKHGVNGFAVLLLVVLTAFGMHYWDTMMTDEPEPGSTATASPESSAVTVIEQPKVPYKVKLTFEDALLGSAQQEKKLEVMTQEITATYNASKDGLWHWDVFKQTKGMNFHGLVTYTVDVSGLNEDNFDIDNDSEMITIHIPEPEYSVEYLPEETEFFDTANGLLRVGEMQLTPEMQTEMEKKAKEMFADKVENDTASKKTAEKFAELMVKDLYEPIVIKLEKALVEAADDEYAVPINYSIQVVIDQ